MIHFVQPGIDLIISTVLPIMRTRTACRGTDIISIGRIKKRGKRLMLVENGSRARCGLSAGYLCTKQQTGYSQKPKRFSHM